MSLIVFGILFLLGVALGAWGFWQRVRIPKASRAKLWPIELFGLGYMTVQCAIWAEHMFVRAGIV
jgi:hypothetical protein